MTGSNTDPEDTGQISVAELLARNGQKTNLSSGGRRRRGAKGGISVAELTGEIPVVRDAPVAAEAPVIAPEPEAAPTPDKPETAARETPKLEVSKPEVQRATASRTQAEPELLSGSTTAAGDLLNKAHDESERRPYGSVPSQRPVPATARRSENSGGRNAGFVPRSRFSRNEAEPKTDVTAKTEAEPDGAAKPGETTTVSPTAKPKTQALPVAPKPNNDAKTTVAKPADAKRAVAETAGDRTATAEKSSEDDEAVTQITDAVADRSEDRSEDTADSTSDAPVKKDAAKQWLVLAGQGVVSIIVGALLFKGFEKLWDMLPWVALILAVLVIVGLVAVVRILRRTDDMISMVIAIAVGVFVTLGPLAFQLSTG